MIYVMNGPLDLTFGVELEFLVKKPTGARADEAGSHEHDAVLNAVTEGQQLTVYAAVATTLQLAGLDVNTVDLSSVEKRYERWTVTRDGSIHADASRHSAAANQSYVAVEVKSPVMLLGDCSLREVRRAVAAIRTKHCVVINDTCGLHVHVGNLTRGFPLSTLRNTASILAVFERQLSTVHSPGRLRCQWAHPLAHHERLAKLARLRKAIVIARLQDIPSFIDFMNPPPYDRNQAYNFMQLHPERVDGLKTIEFRQHAGCLEGERVVAWIELATGIVRFAHCVPLVNVTSLLAYNANRARFDLLKLLDTLGLSHLRDFYASRLESELRPLTPVKSAWNSDDGDEDGERAVVR